MCATAVTARGGSHCPIFGCAHRYVGTPWVVDDAFRRLDTDGDGEVRAHTAWAGVPLERERGSPHGMPSSHGVASSWHTRWVRGGA